MICRASLRYHGERISHMIYIRCPHCGRRVPRGEKCPCDFKREYSKPVGIRRLYHTSRWARLRAAVMSLYNGIDPYAQMHGRIEYADTVHHIIPADEEPDLFFNGSNLLPVSRHSHDEIHTIYRQGGAARQELITELRSLVKTPSFSFDD